jgi:hypothetical protein
MHRISEIFCKLRSFMDLLTATIKVEAQNQGIDASSVYETKSMGLGNDVKNLVILISNEGDKSQNVGDQN